MFETFQKTNTKLEERMPVDLKIDNEVGNFSAKKPPTILKH